MNDISEFKKALHDYLKVIQVSKLSNLTEKERHAIQIKYDELFNREEIIKLGLDGKQFTVFEEKAISCLSLIEAHHDLDGLLLLFKDRPELISSSLADIIKSKAGFDLINRTAQFEDCTNVELDQIFGECDGLQVAKDCIKRRMTKEVGHILGYALSGLHALNQVDSREVKGGELSSFATRIRQYIAASGSRFYYLWRELGDDLEVSGLITDNDPVLNLEVDGFSLIDHCFVDHSNKLITVGQSSFTGDKSHQNANYQKATFALEQLVSRPKLSDKENPFFGYRFKTYLMFGGRMGQMEYWRLLGFIHSWRQALLLASCEPFIAGYDTSRLRQNLEAAKGPEEEMKRYLFSLVTSELVDVCTILHSGNINFADSDAPLLLSRLNDVILISKKLFLNFDFKLSLDEYQETVVPLHDALVLLIKRLKPVAGQYGNGVLNDLVETEERLESIETYNRRVDAVIHPRVNSVTWIDLP